MRLRFTIGLIALLVATGCAGHEETTPVPVLQSAPPIAIEPPVAGLPASPAKVGLLVPLTGASAALGEDLVDAAQMGLFDVGRTDLELLPRDTGDEPAKAEAAALSALDAGAELLLGPVYGRSAQAIAPLAATHGVNVISFSNDAGVARPGMYVLGFRPEEQVERIVRYSAAQGRTRFAALAPGDAYGSRALAAWRGAIADIPGATASIAVTYPPGGDVPKPEVQQVAAFGRPGGLPPEAATEPGLTPPPLPPLPPPGFDAVLIADGGQLVRSIAALLAYYDVGPATVALQGTMRWRDDPNLLTDAGLQGAVLATWPPDSLADFTRHFAQVYGRDPAPLAVLAYDATALAVLLAQGTPRFTSAQLTDPQGFAGGAGIFRLRPDGLAEHGLAVVEIEGGTTRVVDPAPKSFAAGVVSR